MCTVTWTHEAEGYQLFFNRDEKRTRRPAHPPGSSVLEGVRFIAPRDGDFGGTWLSVNEFGVSVCLLNGAEGIRGRSRGLLVLDLTPTTSVAGIRQFLQAADLSTYAPFSLVAIEPGAATIVEWNGRERAIRDMPESHGMLTSSSFDTAAVVQRRYNAFASLGPITSDLLGEFHRSHGDEPSAYSTCMHRPDAETVSFSHIRVTQDRIEFRYVPSAPCSNAPAVNLSLHRSTAVAGGA